MAGTLIFYVNGKKVCVEKYFVIVPMDVNLKPRLVDSQLDVRNQHVFIAGY